MIVVTGVESPQIYGGNERAERAPSEKQLREIQGEQ